MKRWALRHGRDEREDEVVGESNGAADKAHRLNGRGERPIWRCRTPTRRGGCMVCLRGCQEVGGEAGGRTCEGTRRHTFKVNC